MTDVFLSYSRSDAARAAQIHEKLTALGLSVFFDVSDQHGIEPGATYTARIGDAINEAKAMLALWSPAALKSEWCRRECGQARALGKLIPAAISFLSVEDTREFHDASYLNLIDYVGQGQHAEWARTLHAIAERMTAWLDANASAADYEAVAARAAAVRRAASLARPADAGGVKPGASAAAEAWAGVDKTNMADLEAFRQAFPGTTEAFEAGKVIERGRQSGKANDRSEYLRKKKFWETAMLLSPVTGTFITVMIFAIFRGVFSCSFNDELRDIYSTGLKGSEATCEKTFLAFMGDAMFWNPAIQISLTVLFISFLRYLFIQKPAS